MGSHLRQGSRPRRAAFARLRLAIPAVALLALAPAAAFAHAHLVRSQPAAGSKLSASPAAITIAFSEGVVPRLCGIALSDAAGKPVAVGAPASTGGPASLSVAIGKPLAPGTYKVNWHAASVDSHRTQGQFSFTLVP